MNVNFYGMSVEVPNATNPKEAYERLIAKLEAAGFTDWTIDGYQIEEKGEWQDKGTVQPLFRD